MQPCDREIPLSRATQFAAVHRHRRALVPVRGPARYFSSFLPFAEPSVRPGRPTRLLSNVISSLNYSARVRSSVSTALRARPRRRRVQCVAVFSRAQLSALISVVRSS